ncbi:MAG TPA: RDD family protein [Acidimicrobiales bacterium]|jgi:uncharacterized RDD family membrane protein YckC|nr:RDD family protein [Acidimicrobiales bacterium]
MLYEDRMAVATPEGVTLEFTLAGVGSRFVAALIDVCLQGAVAVAVLLLTAALSDALGGWVIALAAVAVFVVVFGYDVAFETWASGRTLGKRWTGLRVVKTSGAPITFVTSAVRNLLRLVDILPTAYLVGIVAILATPKNQRLGDLAAGTIVVRERTGRAAMPADGSWTGWSASARPPEGLDTWDVSAVTAEEVAAVRQFLARRASLPPDTRTRLARDMASRLRPKVVGPGEAIGPETFLEAVVTAKAQRA